MRFGVVVFPGTWSDCDFHYVISEVIRQHVKYVWHRDRNLADFDCVVLPGGFSYGDAPTLAALKARQGIVFRYATVEGQVVKAANPNGSVENIAGVVNETGAVLGLMPHPERAAETAMGGTDGLLLFQSLLGTLVEDGTFLKR